MLILTIFVHGEKGKKMKNSELKPCPFCGGDEIRLDKNETGHYHAVCTTCECSFSYDWTKEEAITAWNQRAERTCVMKPTTIDNEMFSDLVHEYECYECGSLSVTYYDDEKPNYCPSCGAKVAE